jgi:hypothetical protein
MESFSISEVQDCISKGGYIRWCGYGDAEGALLVQLDRCGDRRVVSVGGTVVARVLSSARGTIRKLESEGGRVYRSLTWNRTPWLTCTRQGAILGLHRGGDGRCGPGVPYSAPGGEHIK